MAELPTTLVYLEHYTDEAMPCRPVLEEWAAWLAKPDPEWQRPAPAEDGAEFAGYTLILLGDVRAEKVDGTWTFMEPVPEGTDTYFMRRHQGGEGWDAEFAANTLADATDCWDEEDPLWFACVKSGSDIRVRFEAAGPRCVVIGQVQ